MELKQEKRIRVCHVSTVDFALRFLVFDQLRELLRQGYGVSAVCSPGPWVAEIEAAGIPVHTISMTRNVTPLHDLLSFWRLVRYFQKERFAIVHTSTPKAGLLGTWAAALAGVPIIIHSNLGFYFHEHSSWLKRNFFIWIERLTGRFADVIFSVDKEDIETAKKLSIGRPEALRYLGGWVDLEKFNPGRFSASFVERKRKELGIEKGQRVIGIVARLVAEKGYLTLFKALQKVISLHPDTVLLVVGPEEPAKRDAVYPSIVQEYGILGAVKFLGARTDVEEIYTVMDVFTLPSFREGIGIAILEASAMKLPVVATQVRGCREAVGDGITGILVPHQNPEKLAAALLWILEHPDEAGRMGEAGRKKMEREFSEQLVFERLDREYARLIQEKL